MNRTTAATLVVVAACLALGVGAVYLLRPRPLPTIPKPVTAAGTPSQLPTSRTSSTPPSSSPAATASPSPSTSSPIAGSPWSVISEFYGDIESSDYRAAWSLLAFDPDGQTYSQFVSGYACTGNQIVTEVSESGSHVTFDLSADNTCANATQTYTGTATVVNGRITSSQITQLSGPAT
jgi:hypothetical protein